MFQQRKLIFYHVRYIIMPDFQSQIVDVNGIQLHYVSAGQGSLILFLHGFPEFWAEWEAQLHEFGKDHQAVAVDLRGYNLSTKLVEPEHYHISKLVEDVKALIKNLGRRKVVLVAHDWGGAVAWAFANRYPDLLEKLIIINSPHPVIFARELLQNPEQQKASRYMLLFRSPEAETKLSENNFAYLINALFKWGSKWHMTDELCRKYIEAWSQPGALTGSLNYYRASPLYPPTTQADEDRICRIMKAPRELAEINVPTLVIWGEQDEALLSGNLIGLDDCVSELAIERIPDGTHWVIHEQPDLVSSLIRQFIDNKMKY